MIEQIFVVLRGEQPERRTYFAPGAMKGASPFHKVNGVNET